jgi:diguanylate cyclase (GGDEF)-like protein/PAS domain S-box-containing protein
LSSQIGPQTRIPGLVALAERRGLALAIAVGLFAAIFCLRFLVGTAGDAVSFLYVIPIVIAAIATGTRGGLIAGAIAFLLSCSWVIAEGISVGPLGYMVRIGVFLLIGGLVGRFASSLRRLEAESARYFDISRDLVCIAGFDGYFKRVNPSFERLLGYREEELLDHPFLAFIHPDDRERTMKEAAAIPEGSGTVQFQNRYLDKAGGLHWLEWNSVGLPEEELIYAVARDVTDRKLLEQELERLSQRDPLTGLFNRRRFEHELRRQLSHAKRHGRPGALLVIDIDRFKEINDSLGHAAGDQALCEVGQALSDTLRTSDVLARNSDAVVARLGGDEFVVLLPEVDEAGAQAVAERLARTVGSSSLSVEGQQVTLRISVGVALYDESGKPEEKELLAAADRAMYEVKASGGSGARLTTSHG